MRITLISRLYNLLFGLQTILLSLVGYWMPRSACLEIDFKEHQEDFKRKMLEQKNVSFVHHIDEKWIDDLALLTQVSPHKKFSNYLHGFLLYDLLSRMIRVKKQNNEGPINVVETGTAKGFSALCMAKAIFDSKFQGKIVTIDLLSNKTELFWNSMADRDGKQSRASLLTSYNELLEYYCVFIQGDTGCVLRSIDLGRVHFAFIDSLHDGRTALNEAKLLSFSQKSGDQILFDDYNAFVFPKMISAIEHFCTKYEYAGREIRGIEGRNYFLAEKI